MTFAGKLQNGKVELSVPIDLPDGSAVYVIAQPAIEMKLARRKATGWLVIYVGTLVGAMDGALVQLDDRWVWRFHAYMTSQFHEPYGPIGEVDVDANTGEVLNDQQCIDRDVGPWQTYYGFNIAINWRNSLLAWICHTHLSAHLQ